MKNNIQLHIAGDIIIDKPIDIASRNSLFFNGKIRNLIANLECPITESTLKINKTGPNLKAPPKLTAELTKIGCRVLNLCNNHIMDYGEEGLNDTIKQLKKNNLDFFGVGKNIKDSSNFKIIKIETAKIALYAVCEHEWSVATKARAGANPIDIISFLNLMKNDYDYDYLIVFIHGGKEYYPYPTPNLQKLSRFYADYGAHAVVCQHTHIAGCYEEYNNVPIFYGQGNFIFPNPGQNNFSWNAGFLIQLNFDNDLSWKIIPYKQDQTKGSVYYLEDNEREEIINSIQKRSNEILDEEFVVKKWKELCRKQGPKFIRQMTGINKRAYNWIYKLKLDRILFQKKSNMSRQAMIKCETHRELIDTYLETIND